MNTEPKKDPSARMRSLLGGNTSPLSRLPKRNAASPSFPSQEDESGSGAPIEWAEQTRATNSQAAARPTPPKPAPVSEKRKFNFWPALWTIASILSLTINVALAIILLLAWKNVPSLNVGSVQNTALEMGTGLLGGLYTNFEKMDRAHITRTIPVSTTIPVKFDLLLNQQTNVVLSQDVTIDNALVTVRTGGLNISRAVATIVLPQGTTLPVVLNLTVPVDTTVPVALNVDVDIPLNETQLHDPFVGLREVVEPYYCMINPTALNLDGQPVCK